MEHDTPPTPSRLRSGPPTGPRTAGLAVVLPPPAAAVVDLGARRARAAVVDLAAAERAPRPARPARPQEAPTAALLASTGGVPGDESSLSIQDRVRLRALEAARR